MSCEESDATAAARAETLREFATLGPAEWALLRLEDRREVVGLLIKQVLVYPRQHQPRIKILWR